MAQRDPRVLIWLGVLTVCGLIVVPMWRALERPWACYARYVDLPTVNAVFVERLEGGEALFRMTEGDAVHQHCMVRASYWNPTDPVAGQALLVVYSEQVPGECVPVATVENSAVVLWLVSALVGLLLLPLILVGVVLHRNLGRVGSPQRRMDVDPGQVLCPACGAKMSEGYIPVTAGIHWRDAGQRIGLPSAVHGLAGTVGWRRRPMLHAFQCAQCEIVSFQYGAPSSSRAPGQAGVAPSPIDPTPLR